MTGADTIRVEPARDEHANELIELIGPIFAEYPGVLFDVDGEMPELRAIATSFAAMKGEFWTAFDHEQLVGCVGYVATADGAGVELRKLYVAKSQRRRGLANRLCDLVEATARRRDAGHVELWSDVEFTAAHRFYEARGYQRDGRQRELHDSSDTVEYYFRLEL